MYMMCTSTDVIRTIIFDAKGLGQMQRWMQHCGSFQFFTKHHNRTSHPQCKLSATNNIHCQTFIIQTKKCRRYQRFNTARQKLKEQITQKIRRQQLCYLKMGWLMVHSGLKNGENGSIYNGIMGSFH